jgi:hypothetical protein
VPQSRSGRHEEVKILARSGTRTLGRPARSQSLYRLRYWEWESGLEFNVKPLGMREFTGFMYGTEQ